ncbi:thiol reductase thioredoxin [Virgibacillus dakarensis]|uniref:Thioredoxin-like protein YtpP n=1 Tax=Lentibacillus populi TaxID=1827502 RepID=A0A9W5TTX3_9BACI|nr:MULTISPECIES: thioredoxin family protein [Bacillaceae]MBT2216621.1 thioredoxin family protein [Virgibacillus dakarensis]MTW87764.1 thiol reductase thioredoxin [Virgibacillus dakarensis]GGB27125.1 thioredoxin-like protein YtpP [Lentibacillus populi]
MQTLETKEQFVKYIENDSVIALFSADWCPDCRVIEPILPEIEHAYPAFTFILIDRDQFIELCQEYDVFGIPSFIAFKEGEEIDRFVSKDRKTKEEIEAFLDGLPD